MENVFSLAAQRTVPVIVKEESAETTFHIHTDILSASSVFFSEKISQNDSETDLKPLILNNVSLETFNVFSRWIYSDSEFTDGIVVDELNDVEISNDGGVSEHQGSNQNEAHGEHQENSGHDESEDDEPNIYDRVFGRLLELYVFGANSDCPGFRQAVILQLQRCIHDWTTIPGPVVVKDVLDHLDIASPLCKYLIACYGHYGEFEMTFKGRTACLHSGFLAGVLDVTFARLRRPSTSYTNTTTSCVSESWCDFHEHNNGDEHRECEHRRSGDLDMLDRKRRFLARRAESAVPRPRQTARKSAPSLPDYSMSA